MNITKNLVFGGDYHSLLFEICGDETSPLIFRNFSSSFWQTFTTKTTYLQNAQSSITLGGRRRG